MTCVRGSGRRRSYLQRWVFLIAVLAAVPCAIVGHEVWWAYTAAAAPSVDYRSQFRALIERSQSSGTNGMAAIRRALEIYAQWEGDPDVPHNASPNSSSGVLPVFDRVNRGAFDRVRLDPELRAMEELSARGWDSAIAAAAAADCFVPLLETDPGASTSGTTALHNVNFMALNSWSPQRVSVARMRERAVAGDAAGARAGLAGAFAASESSGAWPLLVRYLISNLNAKLALREVRHQLADGVCPEELVALYRSEIEKRQPRMPSAATVLEGERLFMLDGNQYIYASNGRFIRTEYERLFGYDALTGDFRDSFQSTAAKLHWSDNLLWWKLPKRTEAEREIRGLIDGLAADLTKPRAERTFDFDGWGATLHPVSRRLWEASRELFRHVIETTDVLARDFGATRIMLALEQYHGARGAYPQTLDALTPEYLELLPADPFSPDGQFVYRRGRADHERSAFAYTLYSVGENGTDDGLSGELDEAGAGSDVLFTIARPMDNEE